MTTVTLTATYDCVWWPPDEDPDPITWGGFCDPCNPWGTADDDPPPDPTCSICGEPITWRHDYYAGYKVNGATGWLQQYKLRGINYPYEHVLPDHCEHRPAWEIPAPDREPIRVTLDLWEAVEFIHYFQGGSSRDFRNGVDTTIYLHVEDGPGEEFAFIWARFLDYAEDQRLKARRTA